MYPWGVSRCKENSISETEIDVMTGTWFGDAESGTGTNKKNSGKMPGRSHVAGGWYVL